MDDAPVIEVRLDRIMQQRGVSVPKLATMAGLHTSRVYSLLKDPERLHLPTLARVCRALSVEPGDVLVLAPEPIKAATQ